MAEPEGQPPAPHTGHQAGGPLPQLAAQLPHQAGVPGPGGGLVEGVNHEGLGLGRQLSLCRSVSLVPVVPGDNNLRSLQLEK